MNFTYSKYLLLVLSLVLVNCIFIHAQETGWERLNSAPDDITVFATNTNTLFAGTNDGLYTKEIGDTFWKLHPSISYGIIRQIEIINDRILVHTSTQTIIQTYSVSISYVTYVSSDGGESFEPRGYQNAYINGGPHSSGSSKLFGIQIADESNYYIPLINSQGAYGANTYSPQNIFTTDGGENWQNTTGPFFTHATSDNNGTYYVARPDSIFISDDPSFETYTGDTIPMRYRYYNYNTHPYPFGDDISGFEYKDGSLYLTYKDTMLVSTDNGANWNGYSLSDLSTDEYSSIIFFKLLDDGYFYLRFGNKLFKNEDPQTQPWELISLDEHPNFSIANNIFYRIENGVGIHYSLDKGETWLFEDLQGMWNNSGTLSCLEDELWLSTNQNIYRSNDDGLHWEIYPESFYDSLGRHYIIKDNFFEHQGDLFLQGTLHPHSTGNSHLFISEDDGLTWQSTGLFDENIPAIKVSHTENRIYVITYYQGDNSIVYYSEDKGINWQVLYDEMDSNFSTASEVHPITNNEVMRITSKSFVRKIR